MWKRILTFALAVVLLFTNTMTAVASPIGNGVNTEVQTNILEDESLEDESQETSQETECETQEENETHEEITLPIEEETEECTNESEAESISEPEEESNENIEEDENVELSEESADNFLENNITILKSGKSNNVEWKIKTIDDKKHLIINGTGDIERSGEYGQVLPWHSLSWSSWADIESAEVNWTGMTNLNSLFYNLSNLRSVDLSGLDTSKVTDMSYMFYGCGASTIDVSGFDTSNVTDMHSMFEDCYMLSVLDLSGFDTSNVKDMNNMFDSCMSLTSLDVSSFDTSNVKDMNNMFDLCVSLTSLDVSSFNTSNVRNTKEMFSACKLLTALDVSNWDTSNVSNMSGMFSGCESLSSLDVSGFSCRRVQSSEGMFAGCSSLSSLDISGFNIGVYSRIYKMSNMFSGCSKIALLDMSQFQISEYADDIHFFFSDCDSLTTIYTPRYIASTKDIELPEGSEWITPDGRIIDRITSETCNMIITRIAKTVDNESTVQHIISVLDADTKKPINKACVQIGNRCYYTEQNGYVTFNCSEQNTNIDSISAPGYTVKKSIALNDSSSSEKVTIYLDRNESNENDVSHLNISAPEFSTTVDLKYSTKIGNEKIDLINLKNIEFEIKNSILKSQIKYDFETDTYKVLFGPYVEAGGSEDYELVKDSINTFKKTGLTYKLNKLLKNNPKTPVNIAVKGDCTFLGYMSFKVLEGGKIQPIDSGAVLALSAGGSITYRFAATGGLVYVKASFSVGATGEIKFVVDGYDVRYIGTITLEQKLGVAGGIGTKSLHGEVGLEGKLAEEFSINNKRLEKIDLTGTVYYEVKVFSYSHKHKEPIGDGVNLYTAPPIQSSGGAGIRSEVSASYNIQSFSDDICNVDTMQMMSRDYQLAQINQRTVDQTDVYPDGTPEIVVLEDGTVIAVWVADFGNKSSANRTTLVYAVNKEGVWSEATAVKESGRADFYPALISDGTTAYLVWSNYDEELSDDVEMAEALTHLDIYYSAFDGEVFTEPILVSESGNDKAELEVAIAKDGDKTAVVWVENSENNPFLTSGKNSIYVSYLCNGIFETKQTLLYGLKSITSLDIGFVNNELYIAYTMDVDGNLSTAEDAEVFLFSNGKTKRVSQNGICDQQVSIDNGKMYWISGNNLVSAQIQNYANPNVVINNINNYHVNQGNITYLHGSGFTNELYYAKAAGAEDMSIVPITNYGEQITDYAMAVGKDGKVKTVCFVREIDRTSEEITGKTNLYFSSDTKAYDISLDDLIYDTTEVKVNSEFPISMIVTNHGSEPVKQLKMEVKQQDTVIDSKSITCEIMPGEQGRIETFMQIGSFIPAGELIVVVTPTEDSVLSDNQQKMTLSLCDIELSEFEAVMNEDGSVTLTGNVSNIGHTASEVITYVVKNGGKDGEELSTGFINSLVVGAIQEISFTIPNNKISFDEAGNTIHYYVECSGEAIERAYGNNSLLVPLRPVDVTSVTLNEESKELKIGESIQLSVTVAPAHAFTKDVVWHSSNPTVATVSESGTVVAKTAGSVVITAFSARGEARDSCIITVVENEEEMVAYSLNHTSVTAVKDMTFQLTVVDNANVVVTDALIFSSEDETVASVSEMGEVKALQAGETIINVTVNDHYILNCIVLVEDVSLQSISLDKQQVSMVEGDNVELEVSLFPVGTVKLEELKYESSDDTVAMVSKDGVITAVKEGNAKIIISYNNEISVECSVSVTALPRYTVTFDYGYEGKTEQVSNLLVGSTVEGKNPRTREGYTFGGWYLDDTLYDFSTPINEDIVLYASWIVMWDEQDNLGGVLPEDIPENGEIPESIWIAGLQESYDYTGQAIKPLVRIYDNDVRLREKIDYTITYKNNVKVNDASNEKTAPTIVIKGKGNYSEVVTVYFKILPKSLADEDVLSQNLTSKYNGRIQKKIPTVTWNGKKLRNNLDYTVEYPDTEENPNAYKEPGDYQILIKGRGNYTGEKTITYTVTNNELISKAYVTKIADQMYTGNAIEPVLSVRHGLNALKLGVDYSVEYKDNVNVGTATATITGIGTYSGTKKVTFKIIGTSIASAKITGMPSSFVYSGSVITTDSDVWEEGPVLTVLVGKDEYTLVEGADYDISYRSNTDKGTAIVQFIGKGAYTGKLTKTFRILAYDIAKDESEQMTLYLEMDSYEYEKGGNRPKPVVMFGNTVLTEKKDYTLSYRNNYKVNDGSNVAKAPIVIIKGKGNFSGSKELSFAITSNDLSDLIMSAEDKVFLDREDVHESEPVIVTQDGQKLKKGQDYEDTLTYCYKEETALEDGTVREAGALVEADDIVPVGTTLEVIAIGKGNYEGLIKSEYRIVKYDISKASITIPKRDYTGKAITLDKSEITVKLGDTVLNAEDYEIVTYQDNIDRGRAKVTIRGVGDYGGTRTAKFTIKSKLLEWWEGVLSFLFG